MKSVWPNGKPSVGDSAEMSRTVRADDIALFTDLSGDRNPLHYDEEVAEASRFGEIVVQGTRVSLLERAGQRSVLDDAGGEVNNR